MPGYEIKVQTLAIHGAADLQIRSLLDNDQFADPGGAAEALGISSAQWEVLKAIKSDRVRSDVCDSEAR